MRALTIGALAALPLCVACAGAPPRTAATVAAAPFDSTTTLWGDELDEPIDSIEVFRAPRALRAEWVGGATHSSRLDATSNGFTVRARSQPRGDTGTITWQGTGALREVAVGHVMPVAAEAALVGTASNSADLRASSTLQSDGLRMAPSTSLSTAATGMGVVLHAGTLRMSAGGCETRDERRFGFAGLEHRSGANAVGAVAGFPLDLESRGAASVFAAREGAALFASGEVAVAQHRVRTVVRIVAGERREWSAIAIAGAGPARDEPLVFNRRERWGGAVERRDAWAWGASRAGASSLTRRDDETDVQRRRVSWDGLWRMGDGVQVELAARFTREISERRASGYLPAAPDPAVDDEWRARATLRAARATDGGLRVENAYRLEWVQNRSGRPGTVATWTGRLRTGPLEATMTATAHALLAGQVAYATEAAPLATGQFAAISGRGAAMTASGKLWLRRDAWVGTTWASRPPAQARLWVSLGLRL